MAEAATGAAAPWPALAMLLVGLVITIVGLAILTARSRDGAGSPPVEPGPVPSPRPEPRPTPTLEAPARVADERSELVGAHVPEPVAHDGPCDWELRVDGADAAPTVVRPATGEPCCVHVLQLRALDAWPVPSEREDRSWSGHRTRIGPSRAVSDVRVDTQRVAPLASGLDLALEAMLARDLRAPVVTTAEELREDLLRSPPAEQLWAAHLARLREAGVVSDPDDAPARLQSATRHRTELTLLTTRGCGTGAHRVDATADVSISVEGWVHPDSGARLGVHVAGWVQGDLQVAATDPVDVAAGTQVHPAPGTAGPSGLAVTTAPGARTIRGTFHGHGENTVVDRETRLLVAAAVVADLGLGEGPSAPVAGEASVRVAVAHRVRLVVAPHTVTTGDDEAVRTDLGCSCAPAYEVGFGGPSEDGAPPSDGSVHVEGRTFRLDAVGDGRDGTPAWTVRLGHDGDTETPGMITR